MSPIVVALRHSAGRGTLVFGSESAVASCYAELSSLTVVTDISGEKARIMCSSPKLSLPKKGWRPRHESIVHRAPEPIIRRWGLRLLRGPDRSTDTANHGAHHFHLGR
jgi:hypothetical protein